MLLVLCCLFHVVCCLLFGDCGLLFVDIMLSGVCRVYVLVRVDRFSLFVMCCSLSVVRGWLVFAFCGLCMLVVAVCC